MFSLTYKDLTYFLDSILPQEIIDLTWYASIDPLYWAILKAEKDRRQEQGRRMNIKLDPLSPASIYSRYILGHLEKDAIVPIRTIKSRAHADKFTHELVNSMKLYELGFDIEYQEIFKYIISELLTNAVDHGKSYAIANAQRLSDLDEIGITVVDTGLGLLRTIGRKYKVSSSSEAIKLAIKKNISGAMDYLYGSAQRNVGMGLYVISKIVKDTDGVMCIVSDDSIAKYTPSGEYVTTIKNKWQGTIVMSRFNLRPFIKVFESGFITYMSRIIDDIEKEL